MNDAADKNHWINRRIAELEEKAGVTQLPEFDMDGSRFQPEEDWETVERDDAYSLSISWRMGLMMGIVHPMEWEEWKCKQKARRARRSNGGPVHV